MRPATTLAVGVGVSVVAVAWAVDVMLRPALAAARVRKTTTGPVLNVGAGMRGSSLATTLFGPRLHGDLNCDIAATTPCNPTAHSNSGVCHCDVTALPWPDKHFATATAYHTLDQVADPDAARRELQRVATRVVTLSPLPFLPHAWVQYAGGNRWACWDDACIRRTRVRT